jgi:type II secretory ATPase GspE/PulE/Tfp pilus assembly ATPase PilB-like protein
MTGPTGSGKSTSLYAILQRVSQPNVNIVTLEDPVEYELKGINQSQIKPKIGFTFAEGLRAAAPARVSPPAAASTQRQ